VLRDECNNIVSYSTGNPIPAASIIDGNLKLDATAVLPLSILAIDMVVGS
jgi:hypothetical protein